jgi:small-conductance mechanosensitive channel
MILVPRSLAKARHWIIAIVLALLVAAAIAGMVWTRALPAKSEDTSGTTTKKAPGQNAASTQRQLVDQRPLQTARRMAALAGTHEEQMLAHEAERAGDHEVDLAFFDAMRTAEENPPPLSPEAKEIAARKEEAERALRDDQESIAQLTRKLAAAPESQKDNLQDQIDVAKAQLDLDQDEVDDASEDLEEAGGDLQAKIKRLKAEHDAGDQLPKATGTAVNPHEQEYQSHTLLNVFRAWQALREKRAQLEAARAEATNKQQRLAMRHATLSMQVEKEKENREAAKQQAKGFSKSSNAASREDSKAAASAALDSLKQYTRDQKNLADLGRRVQDEQSLNDVYSKWIVLIESRERAALHNLIESTLWILLVLLAVYVASRLIERLFTGVKAENKRIDTLRAVVKFATQAIGVIVIAFLVFGMPNQTTTVLGLAGAGLTVAMKDFIVGFFGWFVLMGRNGLRVGDWVEINGVAGEVIEVGLLKTILLETGNWTDAGHPTGRRVSFVNTFAIEGHFFNFTTSGQWMWDELDLTIPSGQDPYALIDGLQRLVTKETETNARQAEEEWSHTTARYRVQSISAAPAINVRPSGSEIEVSVRYITRAYERYETRKKLYGAVLELMHGKRETVKQ